MSRPVQAHDPATALRIEPIHDPLDEHPYVPVVVEHDYFETFAKLKLLFPDASHAAAETPEIYLRRITEIENCPNVRAAVRIGRRIFSHRGLKASAESVRGRVSTPVHTLPGASPSVDA
jgi:hypothetical protein